jgi:hypothetical protein
VPDVPSTLPTELLAGNSWQWDRDYGDYPQPTWTATAYFEKAGKTFGVAATASGTAQRFTIAAATTATYPPGRYRIRVRATDGSQVFVAESGWCQVEVDPAAAGTYDTRTDARKMLDAINAFLIGNASTAQASMSIAGRQISRWPLAELTKWRDQLKTEVRTEEQGSRAGAGRNLKVRYGRP